MGLELSHARTAVENIIAKYGCLPSAPDGPIVEHFDRVALAQAIESEVQRASLVGWTKITLHMDMLDAMQLARVLRG